MEYLAKILTNNDKLFYYKSSVSSHFRVGFQIMKKSIFIAFIILFNCSLFAQIKGKTVDDQNQPIPFVNIQIENENIGTTSEENGTFIIHESGRNKNLVFTAIGYNKKIVKCIENLIVTLQTSEYQLNEVVIIKRLNTKEKEIGKTDNLTASAFDNGPKIDAKFFAYLPKYSKTRFIKQVAVQTDSKIDNVSFKIHFYGVDKNGFPAKELLRKNMIVSVSKGTKKTFFNVLDLNLQMPKNGIFVAFEKLIIDKNKLEKLIIDKNNNSQKTQTTYYPFVLYNYVARDFQFTYVGGKWNKQSKTDTDQLMIYEPAINLVLSN